MTNNYDFNYSFKIWRKDLTFIYKSHRKSLKLQNFCMSEHHHLSKVNVNLSKCKLKHCLHFSIQIIKPLFLFFEKREDKKGQLNYQKVTTFVLSRKSRSSIQWKVSLMSYFCEWSLVYVVGARHKLSSYNLQVNHFPPKY